MLLRNISTGKFYNSYNQDLIIINRNNKDYTVQFLKSNGLKKIEVYSSKKDLMARFKEVVFYLDIIYC
ncbi:MAG: hypothetical protein ACRC92_21530 [Peptostreptococcaceae bacterium]